MTELGVLATAAGATLVWWPVARAVARRIERGTAAARELAELRARVRALEARAAAVHADADPLAAGVPGAAAGALDAGAEARSRTPR